jgi:hypothetical protein
MGKAIDKLSPIILLLLLSGKLFLAQAKNHRGNPLFELNSLLLSHGRQRITDASPYGATK